MSYKTGGKVPGKSGEKLPGPDAQACDLEAQSTGTSNGPAVGKRQGPGGYGSSGTASDSKPSGM